MYVNKHFFMIVSSKAVIISSCQISTKLWKVKIGWPISFWSFFLQTVDPAPPPKGDFECLRYFCVLFSGAFFCFFFNNEGKTQSTISSKIKKK